MKILVIGLGSMGMRRLDNLRNLQEQLELHAVDMRGDRAERAAAAHPVTIHPTLEDALAIAPDAALVCTPPAAHTSIMLILAQARIPFMVEASVIDDGIEKVIDITRANGTLAVPSATMRFHPAIKLIRQLLVEQKMLGEDIGRCSFYYHMGQYLPDWHPHENINAFYVGQRETSGAREMVCFESVWLSWLFGAPASVACLAEKKTELDVDIEDTFHMILKYASRATGSLMIDVVSRVPYRSLRVISEHGVIEWSARENMLRCFEPAKMRWSDLTEISDEDYPGGNFSGEVMYRDEVAAFFAALKGDRQAYPYSFEEDRLNLALLRQALVSNNDGQVYPVTADAINQT